MANPLKVAQVLQLTGSKRLEAKDWKQMKRALIQGLWAIALLFCGCAAELQVSVEIAFRDPQSRQSVQEVHLWALGSSSGSCEGLLPGWLTPDSQEVIAHATFELKGLDPLPQLAVPDRELVLFSEARPASNGMVLRACRDRAKSQEPGGSLRLELDWVCTWTDGTCLPPFVGTSALQTCRADEECAFASTCALGRCLDGQCRLVQVPDGTACDDGQVCTARDACRQGVCQGESYACDDRDPCTEDSCRGDGGCDHGPLSGSSCDDGDPCTTADTCQQGQCVAGPIDRDQDRDGAIDAKCKGGTDCNDTDPNIRPGAVEGLQSGLTCLDRVDNDCDGQIDQQQPSCLLFNPSCEYRVTNLQLGEGVALGARSESAADVLLEAAADTPEQSWKVVFLRSGAYRLTCMALGSGMSLHYDRDKKTLRMNPSTDQKAQGWKLTRIRVGVYRLGCLDAGDRLSLEIQAEDPRLFMGTTRKQDSQYWKIIPLGACPR